MVFGRKMGIDFVNFGIELDMISREWGERVNAVSSLNK